MSKSSTTTGGIGFFGILFLIFLTLKLTNQIDWSWWWVTSPLWWGFALVCGVTIFVVLLFLIITAFKIIFR